MRGYQDEVDGLVGDPAFSPITFWQNRRTSVPVLQAMEALKQMAGARQRCMYCVDSLGSDIDHFWPKSPFPGRMYMWENLVLSCTPCGRIKGNEFPLANEMPLLIDPTSENPWDFLDFDSETGNIVPRVERESGTETIKGRETVRVLQLDRREAIANGYRKTFGRVAELVREIVEDGFTPDHIARLIDVDDHGLLGWCFNGLGQNDPPFSDLRTNDPRAWDVCQTSFV